MISSGGAGGGANAAGVGGNGAQGGIGSGGVWSMVALVLVFCAWQRISSGGWLSAVLGRVFPALRVPLVSVVKGLKVELYEDVIETINRILKNSGY